MKCQWKQKNGEYIDVDDMSEEHLRNTLKLIIRQTAVRNKEARAFNDMIEAQDIYLYD